MQKIDGQQNYKNLALAVFKAALDDLRKIAEAQRRLTLPVKQRLWIAQQFKLRAADIKRQHRRAHNARQRAAWRALLDEKNVKLDGLKPAFLAAMAAAASPVTPEEEQNPPRRVTDNAAQREIRREYYARLLEIRTGYSAAVEKASVVVYVPLDRADVLKLLRREYRMRQIALDAYKREARQLFNDRSLWSDIIGWIPTLKLYKKELNL